MIVDVKVKPNSVNKGSHTHADTSRMKLHQSTGDGGVVSTSFSQSSIVLISLVRKEIINEKNMVVKTKCN